MSVDTTETASPRSKRTFALKLVGGLALASVGLGFLALYNFNRSNAYLKGVLLEMRNSGSRTTADGCVDLVLAWRKSCRLSRLLCDNFAPRAMKACLRAKDRTGDCRSLPPVRGTTRFGYGDCKARKMTFTTRRACAAAFRMLDQYCRGIVAERAGP